MNTILTQLYGMIEKLASVAIAGLKWVWAMLCGAGSYMYDPPARALRVWFFITGGIFAVALIIGMTIGYRAVTWVQNQFGWGEVKMQPLVSGVDLTKRFPIPGFSVTPAGKPPIVIVSPVKVEKADEKVAPVAKAKTAKAKRKEKTSENFFKF